MVGEDSGVGNVSSERPIPSIVPEDVVLELDQHWVKFPGFVQQIKKDIKLFGKMQLTGYTLKYSTSVLHMVQFKYKFLLQVEAITNMD